MYFLHLVLIKILDVRKTVKKAIVSMHKKIILFIGLLLMPLLLMAEANNISISGQVLNADDKQVRIVLHSFVPGEEDHASTTSLDDKNNFQFVAYIREAMFGRIYYGKHSAVIFVEPGAQLQIVFDASNFATSIRFSGDGAKDNNYLSKFYLTHEISANDLREKFKKNTVEEFVAWTRKRKENQLIELTSSRPSLSPALYTYQQANIDYLWANDLFAYAGQLQNAKGKKTKLPENYYSFIDEVKLHNYDVIYLDSYRSFLTNYMQYLYANAYKMKPEEDKQYYNHIYELAAENLRALPKYHVQAVYLVEAISYIGLDVVKDEYIEFANECPVQPYKNELHELIKMQNVFEVKKPKVVFMDKNGREVPLSVLKGHIVLVRFDNNIQDTDPAELKKRDEMLQQQLAAFKDVKFLQLSMIDNRDAYERMVYADANDYLKSIINRPKPGQQVKLPDWSYVVLNREGLVVSNSLDDPNNELAIEKLKVILQQDDQIAAEQAP
ncbi:transaldolase [Flammeovirgaceae bacterium 311]|nr:transaldolase [Flammeovirgaceae bacterium 311]